VSSPARALKAEGKRRKRSAILRAAVEVIAERGYFAARMADVAERAAGGRRHALPVLQRQGGPPRLDPGGVRGGSSCSAPGATWPRSRVPGNGWAGSSSGTSSAWNGTVRWRRSSRSSCVTPAASCGASPRGSSQGTCSSCRRSSRRGSRRASSAATSRSRWPPGRCSEAWTSASRPGSWPNARRRCRPRRCLW